jgi:hypothetical protein
MITIIVVTRVQTGWLRNSLNYNRASLSPHTHTHTEIFSLSLSPRFSCKSFITSNNQTKITKSTCLWHSSSTSNQLTIKALFYPKTQKTLTQWRSFTPKKTWILKSHDVSYKDLSAFTFSHRCVNIVYLFQNQMWPVQFSCTGTVPSDNVWCNDSEFLLLSVCDVISRAVFQECILRQWTSSSTNRWEWVLFSLETSTVADILGLNSCTCQPFKTKVSTFCYIVSKHCTTEDRIALQ